MTQLIAKTSVFYDGKTHRVGEVFSATEVHARILIVCGKAAPHEETKRRAYKRRDMRAEA